VPELLVPPAPVVLAPDGFPFVPERTILPAVVRWCHEWLIQPDGPLAGDPWRFTNQQLAFLALWYAYDADGRWLYRRGTLRMMKGWGKDPLGAVMALVELLGPSRVDRDSLRAVPYPAPWVDIAAVSRDQTRTTMRLFPQLLPKRTVAQFGLDVNKEIIYANDGAGVIQAVTSSPASLEGGRSSLVLRNETQKWTKSNDGHEMAEVIDGNLAKSRDGAARALSLCNAHVPGEDSVAEREWDAWQAVQQGRARVRDILYYAVEAPPETKLDDEDSLRAGLVAARGDSEWLDPDRLIHEVWDPRTTPSEARRKYLNQVVAAEDAYLAPHEWRACEMPGELEPGVQITLGFDGSKTDDHTGLIATRVEDGLEVVLGHWDPKRWGGEVPRDEVDAAVAETFAKYDVVAFYSDLHPFESYVDAWEREFGQLSRFRGLCIGASPKHTIAWDMRARSKDFVRAAERIHAEIVDGVLKYVPHSGLTEHALNARRRVDRNGVGFSKETRESARKVDLLAAMMLSRLAWHDYVSLPREKKRRQRTGKATFV
jgi:phage terminase large subunit-like protein